MSAQRFIGANSREAMNQVRLALGEEALILSSRMTDEGVEIMALAEETPAHAFTPLRIATPTESDDDPVPISLHHAAAAYAHQTSPFSTHPGCGAPDARNHPGFHRVE